MLLRLAQDGDCSAVEALLRDAGLPTDGVAEHLATFLVAEDGARFVGVAGLELRGADALLRSVAVAPGARGTGLGSALTRRALAEATSRGVRAVYLLTTTAESFFPRFGFEPILWSDVPPPVQASREFQGACPTSAVAMRRTLEVIAKGSS